MPTYQYRCPDCTKEFEVRQAFSDEPITTCPSDGCAGTVRKVFTGVGISFKGDGFYKNDHGSGAPARKSEQKPEQKATSSASGTETSSTKETPSSSNGSKDNSADKGSKSQETKTTT
ncbi:MAG TPA: FmdB family transcriptional regulator [Acidimicrobiaceae bacterium]|nr:FmdB family transcriptional regulator [Acidimicrobiaceae bacterium]HCV36694.1 FmdB family transcriptional regulator [Acidimicrobiaceae bacterium]HJO79704.1 FmdB family zinc ribbon protein [Acidimicrobiales bacterium]|tara:strand:+ start:4244 stop:4594 length:351 start_codon:yes stop_codon:yes gene_type:complete